MSNQMNYDPVSMRWSLSDGSHYLELPEWAHEILIDEHECETKPLKNENAKLREERDHWHVEQVHAYGNWEDAHKRATELEAENAKLRELVRDMYEMAYPEYPSAFDAAFSDRMRELGIEVDE